MNRRNFISGIVAACCAPLALLRQKKTYRIRLKSATPAMIESVFGPSPVSTEWPDGRADPGFDFCSLLLHERNS